MSFRLYADLGNTTLHLGLWRESWVLERRVSVAELWASGAGADRLRAALADAKLNREACAGALVVAGGAHREELCGAVRDVCGTAPRVLGTDIGVPMRVAYDDPSTLGQDRKLAGYAAARLVGAPCIVLDAGTCITCDVVSDDGELLPIGISAGLPTLAAGLRAATPHLRSALEDALARDLAALRPPAHATADSLAAGLAASVIGASQHLMSTATHALGGSAAELVVTGGDGALVMGGLPGPGMLLPMLILDGLRMLDEAEGA